MNLWSLVPAVILDHLLYETSLTSTYIYITKSYVYVYIYMQGHLQTCDMIPPLVFLLVAETLSVRPHYSLNCWIFSEILF